MKLASILIGSTTALLVIVGFAAVVEEERLPDYVVKTVINHELIKRGPCAGNKCLRALTERTNLARHFCQSYTMAVETTVGIFTWCHHPSKLSSACSCEWPATTTTKTTTESPTTTPAGPNCIASGAGCQENQPCCSPYGCVVTTIHGIGTCGPATTA